MNTQAWRILRPLYFETPTVDRRGNRQFNAEGRPLSHFRIEWHVTHVVKADSAEAALAGAKRLGCFAPIVELVEPPQQGGLS